MRGFVVVLIVAAAAVGACVPIDDEAGGIGDVPFETVSRSNYCTGAPAGGVMVQDKSDIPADWKREWFDNADLANHTAFGIALGRRFSGGYAISVSAIRADDDGGIVVFYQTSAPKAGDLVTQALTNPCHIVRTPKITGTARFQKPADNKR